MKLSNEDAVKALEFLGVDAENLDGFKAQFAEKYLAVNRVEDYVRNEPEGKIKKAIIGNVVGEFEDSVRGIARKLEIDLTADDFKGVDKLSKKLDKISEMAYGKIETERSNAKNPADLDKVNKEWESKYSKLQKTYDGLNALHEGLKGEYEGFKTEVITKEKNGKKEAYWNKSFNSLKWSKEADDLKKDGFASRFQSKFEIDIDDKGNEIVLDRATKKQVQSKKNAGNYADLTELLELEGAPYKLFDLTPNQGSQQPKASIFGDNNGFGVNNNNHQMPLNNNNSGAKSGHRTSDAVKKKFNIG